MTCFTRTQIHPPAIRKPSVMRLMALAIFSIALPSTGIAQEEFRSIFDGQTLKGWQGDEKFWRVENGAIVGETTPAKKIDKNIFLAWADGELDDFQLKLKFRISGSDRANSGIQFRSAQADDGTVAGYQADIDRNGTYLGIIYDERGRGILVKRGHQVTIDKQGKRQDEIVADGKQLIEGFDLEGWNEYLITASGNEFTIRINGKVMSQLVDDQQDGFDRKGILALQLHTGPPMKIEFKDIQLKRMPLQNDEKKVVFIAGKRSHGWNQHEHNAGCLLLSNRLEQAYQQAGLPVVTTVYQNGWPADPTALDNADSVVVYCDGGGGHFLHHHGDQFEDIMRRGVGLACIHYGVEVPKGHSGQRFLQWIGGYFETNWSVNPHWIAKFTDLPEHPITRGVKPFEILDEWYYHMRFSDQLTRVSPILTALPSADTLKRPDGPHSGNPDVRKAVLEDHTPQHLAWAFVRGDGYGRGFGFTGGHFHRNWQHDDFRKIVLNAIAWTAHIQIPEQGIESSTPSDVEMDANQDYAKPESTE